MRSGVVAWVPDRWGRPSAATALRGCRSRTGARTGTRPGPASPRRPARSRRSSGTARAAASPPARTPEPAVRPAERAVQDAPGLREGAAQRRRRRGHPPGGPRVAAGAQAHPVIGPAPAVLAGRRVRLEPLRFDARCRPRRGGRGGPVELRSHPGAGRRDDARAYIEDALDEEARGWSRPFATMLAGTGEVVGSTRFLDLAVLAGGRPAPGVPVVAEIGATWLAPSRRSGRR